MIELSKSQIEVLGRPCFACARVAHLLIASGIYADGPKKAEYEQAVFIHWASGLLDSHGADWVAAADKIIKELLEKQQAN